MYINMESIATMPDQFSRREWIKFQLRLRGYSLAHLARELKLSRSALTLALRMPYPRVERAIAEKLQLPPAAIWPERYDKQGGPNRRMGRPRKSITPCIENHKTSTECNGNGRRGE